MEFLCNPRTDCPCLEWMNHMHLGAVPEISYAKILDKILRDNRYCFDDLFFIAQCNDSLTATRQIKLTHGGCYEWVEALEYRGYRNCGTPFPDTKCYTDYSVCYEFIDGEWKLKVTPLGPPVPQFPCEPGCYSICDIMTTD